MWGDRRRLPRTTPATGATPTPASSQTHVTSTAIPQPQYYVLVESMVIVRARASPQHAALRAQAPQLLGAAR